MSSSRYSGAGDPFPHFALLPCASLTRKLIDLINTKLGQSEGTWDRIMGRYTVEEIELSFEVNEGSHIGGKSPVPFVLTL